MFSQRTLPFPSLAAVSVIAAAAQTGSGHVDGVVKDATSAIGAGATVTITQTEGIRKSGTGLPMPGSSGSLSRQNSFNSPRNLQLDATVDPLGEKKFESGGGGASAGANTKVASQ